MSTSDDKCVNCKHYEPDEDFVYMGKCHNPPLETGLKHVESTDSYWCNKFEGKCGKRINSCEVV